MFADPVEWESLEPEGSASDGAGLDSDDDTSELDAALSDDAPAAGEGGDALEAAADGADGADARGASGDDEADAAGGDDSEGADDDGPQAELAAAGPQAAEPDAEGAAAGEAPGRTLGAPAPAAFAAAPAAPTASAASGPGPSYPDYNARNPRMSNTGTVRRPGLVAGGRTKFAVQAATELKLWRNGRLAASGRTLQPGHQVLANPARPRSGHVLVWHNGGVQVPGSNVGYLGAGWVKASALQGGAALLAEANRVKRQGAPRGDRLRKMIVNNGCPVTEGTAVGELYIRHAQSKPADKYWHYTPANGRLNVCRNLPSGATTSIANDVLSGRQPFFIERQSPTKVALYRKNGRNPVQKRNWVYGCMANADRQPDRSRGGWVPLQALKARP